MTGIRAWIASLVIARVDASTEIRVEQLIAKEFPLLTGDEQASLASAIVQGMGNPDSENGGISWRLLVWLGLPAYPSPQQLESDITQALDYAAWVFETQPWDLAGDIRRRFPSMSDQDVDRVRASLLAEIAASTIPDDSEDVARSAEVARSAKYAAGELLCRVEGGDIEAVAAVGGTCEATAVDDTSAVTEVTEGQILVPGKHDGTLSGGLGEETSQDMPVFLSPSLDTLAPELTPDAEPNPSSRIRRNIDRWFRQRTIKLNEELRPAFPTPGPAALERAEQQAALASQQLEFVVPLDHMGFPQVSSHASASCISGYPGKKARRVLALRAVPVALCLGITLVSVLTVVGIGWLHEPAERRILVVDWAIGRLAISVGYVFLMVAAAFGAGRASLLMKMRARFLEWTALLAVLFGCGVAWGYMAGGVVAWTLATVPDYANEQWWDHPIIRTALPTICAVVASGVAFVWGRSGDLNPLSQARREDIHIVSRDRRHHLDQTSDALENMREQIATATDSGASWEHLYVTTTMYRRLTRKAMVLAALPGGDRAG